MSALAILKLERSGFTPQQVEALAEYLDGQVATRSDLDRIHVELKADIARLDARIETESAAIRGEMKTESAAVRGELRLVKWMLALVILGVVIPLIRDLHGLYDKLP